MAVKSIVLYPHPEDKDVFKQRYADEHVPLCEAELPQMTKLSMSKILGSPQGKAPYYMQVELYYETMDALNEDFSGPGGAKVAKHAFEISTGGAPVIMVATA